MTLSYFLAATIVGMIVGSFLTVLIPRLHHQVDGIFFGRSFCWHCKRILKIHNLIPIFSYLSQKGMCRECKTPISFWYPIMEFVSGISFGALTLYSDSLEEWIANAFMFTILLFIFFYDLRFKEIHDLVMIPGIIIAFAATFFIGDPVSSLVGGLIGFTFFALQYLLSQGKWIGSGDLRIGAFMGIMLGWHLILIALVISYVFGSLVSIFLLLTKRADRKTTLPLGPFLVLGSMIAFFHGQAILEWYLTL